MAEHPILGGPGGQARRAAPENEPVPEATALSPSSIETTRAALQDVPVEKLPKALRRQHDGDAWVAVSPWDGINEHAREGWRERARRLLEILGEDSA